MNIQRKIDDTGYTSVDQFCKKHKIIKTTVYQAINNERSRPAPKLNLGSTGRDFYFKTPFR